VELFADTTHGGFFETPRGAEELVARRKVFDDHPAPSGNAMLAYVLLRLARIYGEEELEQAAESVFRLVGAFLPRAPGAFGFALLSLEFARSPRRELAVIGPADSPLGRAVRRRFEPEAVTAFGPSEAVALLRGKTLVDGQPALYVCERFACLEPITDPRRLEAQAPPSGA